MKAVITTILILVLGGLVLLFIGAINTAGYLYNTGKDTTTGIIEDTFDADNVIYNYHWFIQQKEDIVAIQEKIVIAQGAYDSFILSAGERVNWTFEDKTEASRLSSVKQGLQSQYQQMVANYNARSKQADRAIFKDGLVPDVLEVGASFLQ